MANRDVRVMQLADQVFDLSDEEAAAFLQQECGGDPELIDQVKALLVASADADRPAVLATAMWPQ